MSLEPRVIWTAVGGICVLIVASIIFGILLLRPQPRVKDGITAPDPDCIDNVTDLNHPWIYDGRWAGYVNGEKRVMTSREAQALSMSGYNTRGVWLCPPA